jgi:hypothetical protein
MASERAVTVAVVGGIFAVLAATVPIILTKALPGEGNTSTPTPPPIEAPANPVGEVSLFLNKESAPVGATVLVSGRGFGTSEMVDVRIGAETVASLRTSPSGDFANVSVKVPAFFRPFAKPMQVDVSATGRSTIKNARRR